MKKRKKIRNKGEARNVKPITSSPKTEQERSPASAQPTDADHKDANEHIPIGIGSPDTPSTKKHCCYTKNNKSLEGVTLLVALGVLGASIASAFYTGKQVNIATKALIEIERPVIVVSTPEDFNISSGPPLLRPEVCVLIENVGRQVANINLAMGSLTVQDKSDPPVGQITNSQDGSYCNARILGEWVLRPMDKKDITCRRSARFTPVEVDSVARNAKYAFFRFNVIYIDPLGYDRLFASTYLWRPKTQGDNIGRLIQINSEETPPHELTQGQKANNQGALVDTMLQIERNQGAELSPQRCASLPK